ncbi:MAG: PIN domain-containing protein [Candidatus Delongbacteria bacterium]
MIIADTSIWIEFLRNRLKDHEIFIRLIENDYILMPEVVSGELLQGARSEKEVMIIKGYAENLKTPESKGLFICAGEYSFKNKLKDNGVGLIDAAIIVSAIQTNSKIWSLDKKLIGCLEEKYIYIPSLY